MKRRKMTLPLSCFVLFLAINAHGANDNHCAKEGMSAGGSTLNALRCCSGLVATNRWVHENMKEGWNIPPPPGSGGSCVKCGDDKCDAKNFENKCNCPKDCK